MSVLWSRPSEHSCEASCAIAGHCCVGALSACQKPSCAMGCLAGALSAPSEAACNATCTAAAGAKPGSSGCTYALPHTNLTFQMCGVCPAVPAPSWWPASITPSAGEPPGWWPPGYSLPDCNSCETLEGDPIGECKLGCMFAFRPSLKPTPPPEPTPPPPRPPPPACGVFDCVLKGDLAFSSVFSDRAVLQAAPVRAAVYGFVGLNASHGGFGNAEVEVTVASGVDTAGPSSQRDETYSVQAVVDGASGVWKAMLKPQGPGGSYSISARCLSGCTGHTAINDVTYGDVWVRRAQKSNRQPR
jgi:hypothetical protein